MSTLFVITSGMVIYYFIRIMIFDFKSEWELLKKRNAFYSEMTNQAWKILRGKLKP